MHKGSFWTSVSHWAVWYTCVSLPEILCSLLPLTPLLTLVQPHWLPCSSTPTTVGRILRWRAHDFQAPKVCLSRIMPWPVAMMEFTPVIKLGYMA